MLSRRRGRLGIYLLAMLVTVFGFLFFVFLHSVLWVCFFCAGDMGGRGGGDLWEGKGDCIPRFTNHQIQARI